MQRKLIFNGYDYWSDFYNISILLIVLLIVLYNAYFFLILLLPTSMASFTSSHPELALYVRGKEDFGKYLANGKVENNEFVMGIAKNAEFCNDPTVAVNSSAITAVLTNFKFSPSGKLILKMFDVTNTSLKLHTKAVEICESSSGDRVFVFPLDDIEEAFFSPFDNFIVTWSKSKTLQNRYCLWKMNYDGDTFTGLERLAVFQRKAFASNHIQFSKDNSYVMVLGPNEVQVFLTKSFVDGAPLSPIARIRQENCSSFSLSPYHHANKIHYVAIFAPECKGKPASVGIHKMEPLSNYRCTVVNNRTMFAASEGQITWNSLGTALLIQAHTDVDSSNSSYYGSSTLYFLNVDGTKSIPVPLTKEGAVHDAKWSPEGDR